VIGQWPAVPVPPYRPKSQHRGSMSTEEDKIFASPAVTSFYFWVKTYMPPQEAAGACSYRLINRQLKKYCQSYLILVKAMVYIVQDQVDHHIEINFAHIEG
jgi:hypothetical protein